MSWWPLSLWPLRLTPATPEALIRNSQPIRGNGWRGKEGQKASLLSFQWFAPSSSNKTNTAAKCEWFHLTEQLYLLSTSKQQQRGHRALKGDRFERWPINLGWNLRDRSISHPASALFRLEGTSWKQRAVAALWVWRSLGPADPEFIFYCS